MVSTDSLARAVGHPLRVRLIALLDGGPCGLETLASEVGSDPRTVGRHLRVLEQAGMVQRVRSGRTTTYSLNDLVSFSDDEYGELGQTSRQAAVAAALAHCHTAAASALENGGFERDDIHLSRTSLDLTEAQWHQLSGEFAQLLDRIDAVRTDEADDDAEPRLSASAVLMLFERSSGAPAHQPRSDEPFSMDEGIERSWDLSDEIQRALTGPTTDWARIVALADELRVLARAASRQELAQTAAARRAGADVAAV
jgi:DNA-binding transcriptional ArsR family regulator